jgi:phosphoribosylformylglycinamidine synthase
MMKIYAGINALPDFRRTKLKTLLGNHAKVTDITAEYIHLADVSNDFSSQDDDKIKQLLTYDQPFSNDRNGELFFVVPRPGTISPWSSKATDIAKNSGIQSLNRIERGVAYYVTLDGQLDRDQIASMLHDRMTEICLDTIEQAETLFQELEPKKLVTVDIKRGGIDSLISANSDLGLAMTDDEIEYLFDAYNELDRNPTDVELMMFAQVNSEHCRHKIFNADWIVDGKEQPKSLFKMIRNTYEKNNTDILSAYSDNAAVLRGKQGGRFFADPKSGEYSYHSEPMHSVIKVETHNHPTAIAPFPGAATGVGGEIRDEGATGRGAKPKMGLAGYTVSNLNLPDSKQPWESSEEKPNRIASALDIMLEAPIGAASFANEFGRPNLTGYFRTYQQETEETHWGYHKPIMIAGGLGNIRDEHVQKKQLSPGSQIIVLGGPAMLIGLGGGAASSMQTGASSENLDFASVQRANAEMERRAQEVIDACWALGDDNPMITIHDVGAGGLSNALPELVHDSNLGAIFDLRSVPSAESGLSPLEIWCNEAQERYVLGINKSDIKRFTEICQRERCPFAVVGEATETQQLTVKDTLYGNNPVDIPMATLFGKPPKMTRSYATTTNQTPTFNTSSIDITEAAERVLQLPAVGSKKFLITIGDRNVGGLVARDQMIGPWQVPVSDVAVTAAAFDSSFGEAMAMGERTPLAVINAPASARMAIGETITNMAAADIEKISDIKLSANWMAAAGVGNEDQALYETVRAVGEDFCPAVGLTIPVGKDSLSMRTKWDDSSVVSPLSLIITGFSPVADVSRTATPLLDTVNPSSLIFIDLSGGKQRMGGSALAQVYNQIGHESPDAESKILKDFFQVITALKSDDLLLAYHDRSDGGLFTTLVEMAFASRTGLDINLDELPGSSIEKLFNEELGVVIQVRQQDTDKVLSSLNSSLGTCSYLVGNPIDSQKITFSDNGKLLYMNTRSQLETLWSSTSYAIQKLRDNPSCADQEHAMIVNDSDTGLSPSVTFSLLDTKYATRPKVAIFREQGVNGQVEMAAAFDRAGFTSIDVHLNDIVSGKISLDDFSGLVACGGFSYGDVLGAGEGWAKTILFDPSLRSAFTSFFERSDTFTLGVCNGCQMLSALKELIPGTKSWPAFLKNKSEQFEAREVLVRINESPSIFFTGMQDSYLPIPVAHGEGRAQFNSKAGVSKVLQDKLAPLQYVDNDHVVTEMYPLNPNGSPEGITSLTTPDGRATILMPHPERAFMSRQLSWHPQNWDTDSPWLRMFQNARNWVEKSK